MTDDRNRRVVEYRYVSCCWPDGARGGTLFWGAALVALGGIWLVANVIGWDNSGEWVVPVLLAVWGGALLVGAVSDRSDPR